MALENIPSAIRRRYHIEERGHALAILASDFPREFADIMDCLHEFVLRKSHILTPGGGKSPISAALDGFLRERGGAKGPGACPASTLNLEPRSCPEW